MTVLLEAEGLARTYRTGRRLLSRPRLVRAVREVSLGIGRGETLALVGESGCGKSTVGRLLLRLEEADAGRILFDGADLGALGPAALRALRRRMQPVFQDPYASLDPRRRIRDVLEAPIRLHGLRVGAAAVRARAEELLAEVGLAPAGLARFPHEFSGGQRQRVAIARALAVEPDLLVCDEPVSALDVSVQAQVVNLLGELRRRTGVAMLFISHDLAVVRHLADRVAVMYAGRIVEEGPAAAIFAAPRHPYTAALLAAAPRTDRGRRAHAPLSGEPPDPSASDPSAEDAACAFAPRCPLAIPRCHAERPLLRGMLPASGRTGASPAAPTIGSGAGGVSQAGADRPGHHAAGHRAADHRADSHCDDGHRAASHRAACHRAEEVPPPEAPGAPEDTPLAARLALYRAARASAGPGGSQGEGGAQGG